MFMCIRRSIKNMYIHAHISLRKKLQRKANKLSGNEHFQMVEV